jgi:invasion protein IalB
MSYAVNTEMRGTRGTLVTGALAAALLLGFSALPSAAQTAPAKDAAKPAAQPAKDAAKPAAAPAAKDAAAAPTKDSAAKGDEKKSSWVKLCDKVGTAKKDKDGKEAKEEKNVCVTFHDTIDANTGMTVVSAAIREVEGDPKPDLQVTVPLGMVIPAGAKVSALTADQTEKLKNKQDVDPKDMKTADLKFSACLPNGCTAEVEAPQEILDLMKGGGSLLVRSIYVSGQPFIAPVPLQGFTEAFGGKPLDNAVYKKARSEMMQAIRQRQAELVEKFKAEQMKNLPPPPGAEGAASPAAKPADKAPEKK